MEKVGLVGGRKSARRTTVDDVPLNGASGHEGWSPIIREETQKPACMASNVLEEGQKKTNT